MSLVKILALLLMVTVVPAARADLGPEAQQVLAIFRQFSTFDRRSGHEAHGRKWILEQARLAKAKGVKVRWETDKAGNVLLRLDGTGRFADHTIPVALQQHIDMVGAVRGATPGEDLGPYFKNGVQLEIKGDWLQSVNTATSIGADNGIGVAMALRYLLHPEIEHPPLELLFTVEEETTFAGAKGVNFLLAAPVILNLDGEREDEIWIGSMGYGEIAAKISAPISQDLKSGAGIKVTVKGLKGGHSAMVIHEKRINAALAGMDLVRTAQKVDPEVGLLTFRAGTEGVSNVVPDSLVFELLPSSAEAAQRIKEALAKQWDGHADAATDESGKVMAFSMNDLTDLPTKIKGLSGGGLKHLVGGVLSLTNGVVSRDDRFPNSVNTSSNLSYLYVTPVASRNAMSLRTNVMSRSFSTRERKVVDSKNRRRLVGLASEELGWKVQLHEETDDAWESADSWALSLLQRLAPKRKTRIVDGALETGTLSRRYPGRPVLVLGPQIESPHEPVERASLGSVQRTTKLLDRFLGQLADHPDFSLPCRSTLH